jgi:hypothetical protein
MYTIFIEYKIFPHAKKKFLGDIQSVQEMLKSEEIQEYQILEAVDQPDLFVETMKVGTLETYREWKKMLNTEDLAFPWAPILQHIVGGRKKFNMWSFQSIPLIAYGGEQYNERT